MVLIRFLPFICVQTSLYEFPSTTKLIAYNSFMYHNIAVIIFVHSSYFYKYFFQSMLTTFLALYYLKSYPFSNSTLVNIVYICFTVHHLAHSLFKFSFQFEQTLRYLQIGNLSYILNSNIQSELQSRHVQRLIE